MFWLLAAGLPLAGAFLVDPKLGWARDWDLFALLCAPALTGAALWLSRLHGVARRAAAAVAVRNGMTPAAARRAITSAPAAALGISDRVGSIERGRLADLVVFSGDPLDLRSRVLAVYVRGRRVFVAEPREQRER